MTKNKILETLRSKDYIYIYIIIILIITIRCFILEPFRIPSGSMQPTILIGDFIFVNKFIYGIKLPLLNKRIKINKPQKGDIIVFKKDDNKNYIKRVIGVEGDHITYKNKQLYVNNKIIKNKYKGKNIDFNAEKALLETICLKEYLTPKKEYEIQQYKNIKNNKYKYSNITVPINSYFVLGDNRDNSEDSRFWGFVNKKDLIGKAYIIWMSIDIKTKDIRWHRISKIVK